MRIIGGRFRGTVLQGPQEGSLALRPTGDKVRAAMFNLLLHGAYPPLGGARVLDAFAGTGALGLESLSRGAAFAGFLETAPAARALIEANARRLRLAKPVQFAQFGPDALDPGACPVAPFTILFLDPPYGQGLGQRALAALAAQGWIGEGAVVVWEENAPVAWPPGFAGADQRRYGSTYVHLGRRS
jgi:16S rRNA (guanine966-N2)-methyltransferase